MTNQALSGTSSPPHPAEVPAVSLPGPTHAAVASYNRRGFVGSLLSGVAAMLAASPAAQALAGFGAAPVDAAGVTVRLTNSQNRYQPAPSLPFRPGAARSSERVLIDRTQQFQEILGFGGALTDAVCYTFSQMPEAKREALFKQLFAPTEMNLNVNRTCVGTSDYARTTYSYDDTPDDVALRDFSIAYDRAYILPTLKRLRQLNPAMFLFSSPWSPPGWMKAYGSMQGGWMLDQYLEPYARYYVRYLEAYAREGVRIDALTPQNEAETDQNGKMPACLWHPETEMKFVRDHLGPLLRTNKLDVKIWLMDHNYDKWVRAKWMLDDPGVKRFADGVAFHPYGAGTADMMSSLHREHPQVPLYHTEGGNSLRDPVKYLNEWCSQSRGITAVFRNWARSLTVWTLALDEEGRPNIGPFRAGGLVTVNSKTNEVTFSGHYWALAHYSRHVQRGARRIGTEANAKELDHVAFANPDGSTVLVLTNSSATEPHTLDIQDGNRYARFELPPDTVATLTWR